MVKNECYKVQIKKGEFYNVIKQLGMEKLHLSVIETIRYVPSVNNFTEKNFPNEWLSLITTKFEEQEKTVFSYKHYYPENEISFNECKEYKTEISDPVQFKTILKNLGFEIINSEVIKNSDAVVNDKYNMKLQNINKTIYFIEISTIDYHYITREDFNEINEYLKKLGITNIDNGSCFE